MNLESLNKSSSINFALSQSFSRRQMTTVNSHIDPTVTSESSYAQDLRCTYCGKYNCQNGYIFSQLSCHNSTNDQPPVIDKHIHEMIFKRLVSLDRNNICDQHLLHCYNSINIKLEQKPNQFSMPKMSNTKACASNSIKISRTQHIFGNTTGYKKDFLSQVQSFSCDEPFFTVNLCNRLSSSLPSQTFQTQNRAGLYQLCSNGRYIIADDWCQTYKGHRLPQFMRCLTIYNQYEEQCVLMLPEFNTITQIDSIQSMTWHEQLQVFLFITYHRVYQCEPESGAINQINEYEIPSMKHSLAHIACDKESYVYLAYEYPAPSLDLWFISTMATWSLIKRWTPRELFPPSEYHDEDEQDANDLSKYEQESAVCGIASMRYANETLHFLARHERHWCLHLFSVVVNERCQKLIPQRRIDIDLTYLRFSGENFQMEVLSGEQGWLFAIRRPYLIYLSYNGKDVQQISLTNGKRPPNLVNHVCIMDERGKRRENGKHLVVRDANSIRFYKL